MDGCRNPGMLPVGGVAGLAADGGCPERRAGGGQGCRVGRAVAVVGFRALFPTVSIDQMDKATGQALRAASIECQQAQQGRRRWVLYDLASDELLGTRVYNEHAEPSKTLPKRTTFWCCRWRFQATPGKSGEEPGKV